MQVQYSYIKALGIAIPQGYIEVVFRFWDECLRRTSFRLLDVWQEACNDTDQR